MGMFEVNVKLANLAAPGRTEEVSLLVDTGATLSWIPRSILEKLGVQAFSRLPFTLADGHRLERYTTAVLMVVDGRKGAVQVAFGEPGEEAVLGATSLEGLGFMVDRVGQKLIPRDLHQLRLGAFAHASLQSLGNRIACGTNEPSAAYHFLEGLGVAALSRVWAEGVRK